MHDTQLAHLIANDPQLRTRVDSIVRRRTATADPTPVERLMLTQVPLVTLAWEVACNASIFATVSSALDDEAPDVTAAIGTVPDSDLEYVVCQQITCIAP